MAIDLSKPIQKAKLNKDQIIFVQNQPLSGILMVHQGRIEILKNIENEGTLLTEDSIMRNGFRLWVLSDNMICGDLPISLNINAPFSARSVTESIVSVYPLSGAQFKKVVTQKPNLGIMIARSLIRQLLESVNRVKEFSSLLASMQQFSDNIGIALYKLDGMRFIQSEEKSKGSQGDESAKISVLVDNMAKINSYFSKGGTVPEIIESDFFVKDNSKNLGVTYGKKISKDDLKAQFFRRFFTMPAQFQQTFFQDNNELLNYVCEEISRVLLSKEKQLHELYDDMLGALGYLIKAKDSWFNEFTDLYEKSQIEPDPLKKENILRIYRILLDKGEEFTAKFEKAWGRQFPDKDIRISTQLDHLIQREEAAPAAPSGDETNTEGIVTVRESNKQIVEGELKNSMQKIITFSGLDNDTAVRFIKLWKDFMEIKNKMDTESSLRKLRRQITKTYWDIYSLSFIKYVKTGNYPKFIDLMFKFGFLDEKALSAEDVGTLYRFQDTTLGQYEAHNTVDWLKLIYEEKVNPSITELGQTYYEVLRADLRGTENIKISKERLANDTNDKRLKFEIEHMLANGVVTTSGSIGTTFPILIPDLTPANFKKLLVTKKKISDELKEVLELDFSLFHREILYKGNDGSRDYQEFVLKEILPQFIFLPSVGYKAGMWQEMDLKSKDTPARFLIPIIPNAPLKEMLIEACGTFRWELVRSIAGAGWADATAFILTSDYFDYQEFFKKNSKLSPEAREKLAIEFKKFRDPRSRFVNDYRQWMMYEREGIPKLNKVAREIFVKHVPFPKARREQLYTFPAFTNVLDRYANLNKKKKKELENKYFKYSRNDQGLPPELQKNIDFYDL